MAKKKKKDIVNINNLDPKATPDEASAEKLADQVLDDISGGCFGNDKCIVEMPKVPPPPD